jgi:hypothetical protein
MKYGFIPTGLFERLALATGKVPIPVFDALYSIMKARALMAGVRLGVFEALRDGAHAARDIAGKLGLDPDCLELLLRALVLAEYIGQRADGRFQLQPLARRTLLNGAPMELTGFVEWNYTHWEFAEHLEDLLRTGRGVEFHATLTDPAAWGHYQRAMLELARLDAAVVARAVPVAAGATRLLDLAGSHGLLGAAICRVHPPMRSTVLDLPQAIEHARALASAEGITDVVEHRAGTLLDDDFGRDYDVALLANILHHFKPDRMLAILNKTRGALRPTGTVAIWDVEGARRSSPVSHRDAPALFFRLTSTARAYHGGEYADWLRQSGFTNVVVKRPRRTLGNVLVYGIRPE